MPRCTGNSLPAPELALTVLPLLFMCVHMSTQAQSAQLVVVGLDHIPLAVGDLESAGDSYRALGFALKPGRPHDNGIRDLHVKFPNGTEIELITAPEARDSLTSEYRAFLSKGDGPAFRGLYAPSHAQASKQLSAGGIEHRHREGELLTFPATSEFHYLFLGGRNRSATDKPAHFAHPNTAESLIAVWLAPEHPATEQRFLKLLGADIGDTEIHIPDKITCLVARFPEGEVVLLPYARQQIPGRPIVGASIRVRNIDELRRVLRANGIAVPDVVSTKQGRSVFLPPVLTHGLWLEFRELR